MRRPGGKCGPAWTNARGRAILILVFPTNPLPKGAFDLKKHLILPALSVLGGAVAFLLRLLQNRTGFEPDTGLPIPGNVPGLALVVLLAVLATALCVLVWKLPKEAGPGPAFPQDFATTDTRLLTLPVMGVLLIALSGLLDLAGGFGITLGGPGDAYVLSAAMETYIPGPAFSQKALLLMGLLSLASAGGLFLSVLSCRPREGRAANGTLLLIAPAALVVRLVLVYRVDSVDPALEAYYVELLALVFLTLGFYRLSSFAFGAGRTRRFALYTGAAVVLSLAALTDGAAGISSTLLYLGGALTLLGFLLLRLCRPAGDCEAHHSTGEA